MASLSKGAMILLINLMSAIGFCFCAVYEVGDSKGWTNKSNIVDYKLWSSNYTFFVGDTFFFHYDYKSNDVMEVSREDFESCNVRSPINLYTSGRDSIVLRNPGHYYYLCSFPGHCQAGQKVDINVLIQAAPTSSPSPSPSSPLNRTPGSSPSSTPPPTPSYQPTHEPPSLSPTTSIPAASPDGRPPHFSPAVGEAPGPSKNIAPTSFLPSKGGLLGLQLLMALGFLSYF